jgi:hypothetical protein
MASIATTEPSTVTPSKAPARAPFVLNLSEGLRYVFRSPDWFTDLSAGAVCHILASLVVPPAIFGGYVYSVAEALHRQHGTWHPSFRTEKIADYLVRAMAQLALDLAASIFLVTPLMISAFLVFASVMNGTLTNWAPWAVGLGSGWVLFIVISFFTTIMAFRAGIANDFSAAFDFAWLTEFILKTWPELILVSVARVLLRLVLMVVAVATLGIGGLFANAYDQMVLGHWMYQVYRVHLARGGTPIPLPEYRE